MAEPLCGHPDCCGRGWIVVTAVDTPNTLGQTHDCCGRHRCSRALSGSDA